MIRFCEHGYGLSGTTESYRILDWLRNYRPFKEKSTLCETSQKCNCNSIHSVFHWLSLKTWEDNIKAVILWWRRRKQLLDDLQEKRGYCKFKGEALDRTLWRTRFGRGCGPVVRQTTVWMNEWMNEFRDTMDWNYLRLDTHRADRVVYVAKMARVFLAQGREIEHPVRV